MTFPRLKLSVASKAAPETTPMNLNNISGAGWISPSKLQGNHFLETVPFLRLTVTEIIVCLIIFNNIINLVILAKMTSINSKVKALMVSMSASDLMLGVIVGIPAIAAALTGAWLFSSGFCQITGVINGMSIGISMWSLTGISVERFLVIVQPKHLNYQPHIRHVRWGVAFIWLFNTVYHSVPIFLHPDMEYYVYQPATLVCGFVWELDWILYLAAAIYPFVPGSIIVYCSCRIISTIRKNNKRILKITNTENCSRMSSSNDQTSNSPSANEVAMQCPGSKKTYLLRPGRDWAGPMNAKKQNKERSVKSKSSSLRKTTQKREAKASKVMIITALGFFSCSLPYACTAVMEKHVTVTFWHSFAAVWILYCNSFMNVFIYSATYPEFRNLFKIFFLPACFPSTKVQMNTATK